MGGGRERHIDWLPPAQAPIGPGMEPITLWCWVPHFNHEAKSARAWLAFCGVFNSTMSVVYQYNNMLIYVGNIYQHVMHICNITRTKKQHIYSQEGYSFRRDLIHLKQLKEISINIKNGEKISGKE